MRLRVPLTATFAAALAASILGAPPANAASPAPVHYGVTWTVDTANNSLSEYAARAAGAAAPIATIKGGATGLAAPSGVAVSPNGTVYVANAGNNSITEYRNGSSDNAVPSTTIKGSKTGLAAPSSITLAAGQLWVTDSKTNLVEAFTAGSSGNELPAQTIAGPKTGLDNPIGVAVSDEDLGDAGGIVFGGLGEIYVLNAPTTGAGNVTTYSINKVGDVIPNGLIKSTPKHPLRAATAIMSPSFGTVWLADGATNTVSEVFAFPGLTDAETLATITGGRTGLDAPSGLSMDAFGHLVVTNAGDHSIRLFGAHARGDVAPIRTLRNVGTTSGSPAAAAVVGTRPGQPTDLKVHVNRGSTTASATMSWQPPAVTGGGIVGYDIITFSDEGLGLGGIVEIGGGVELIGGDGIHVTTKHTTFTKQNLKLGRSYFFAVVAVNAFGTSRSSRPQVRTLAIAASAPRKVSAASSRHSISLHWAAPAHDGGRPIKDYRIEYGRCAPGTTGCKFHSRVVPSRRDFAMIRGLTTGTKYYARVLARTRHGLGTPSRVVAATPS